MRFVACCLLSAVVLPVSLAAAGEMRTWSAASGGFTVEAEFVELKAGDVVRLKTKDGRVIDVPLGQLSPADRALVRPAAASAAAPAGAPEVVPLTAPEEASRGLVTALRAAERRRRPAEAIALLTAFHDAAPTTPAERALVAARVAELKPLAEQNRVKLNGRWVGEAAAAEARAAADELMRQGIELYKQKQEGAFRDKFAAAAALEPEDLRADFNAGLVYAAGREHAKAVSAFQKCLARDPEHAGALNNLALVAAAAGQWPGAANAWRRALDTAPDRRIVHNVGRFLEQSTAEELGVPKQAREILALPYTELVAGGKFQSADEKIGWLYLRIDDSDLDLDLDDRMQRRKSSRAPPPSVDGPVIGGGTGFVVAPGYLLTNAHVAKEGSTFEVQTPDGKPHKATRIAASEELDLAVLKWEGSSLPALALRPAIAPRGTDVMLLGYPEMMLLGASLKATRGSISSLPDPKSNPLYLYDAVSNAGNSGGPLCDDCGNVVAVHSTGFNTASRYAGGIPGGVALEFLRTAIPDFRPAPLSEKRLDWPEVDKLAGPSTLLIWVRRRDAEAPTSNLVAGREAIETPFCLFCGGDGKTKCLKRGCVGGTIRGQSGPYQCGQCKGTALMGCPLCQWHGVDKGLTCVKLALAAGKSVDSLREGPFQHPYEPPDVAEGEPIDLLPLVDPDQPYSPGLWKREGNAIVGGGTYGGRLAVAYKPPKEYDLVLETRLVDPGDKSNPQFHVGLLTFEGTQFNVGLRNGAIYFGVGPGEHTSKTTALDATQPVRIRYMVRPGEVAVLVGDQSVHANAKDYRRLCTVDDFRMEGDDRTRLFFGAWGRGARWSLTKLELVPVGADRGSPAVRKE